MDTKLVELFVNRVVKRRNMINDYLNGRVYIESVRGSLISGGVLILSFCFGFELFLLFSLFCRFSCLLLDVAVLLLLANLL
jgi:hypothetical protein